MNQSPFDLASLEQRILLSADPLSGGPGHLDREEDPLPIIKSPLLMATFTLLVLLMLIALPASAMQASPLGLADETTSPAADIVTSFNRRLTPINTDASIAWLYHEPHPAGVTSG